ncbi:MAG TPA: hypothetical protein PKK60_02420 [archaeon]|nr:hypothetical protein [archaeon]
MTKRKNLALHFGQHGTNPNARKDVEGRIRKLLAATKATARIEKAHEKRERRLQTHVEQTKTTFRGKIDIVRKQINQSVKLGRVSKRTAAAQTLALDKWVSEELQKRIKETKDPKEAEALKITINQELKVLTEIEEMELMDKLLGNNPTVELQKDIVTQIDKWKKRMPQLIKGIY